MGYYNKDELLDLSDPDGCLCYTCCECCNCTRIRRLSKGQYFCCCCPIYIGIKYVIASTIFFLTLFYTFNICTLWANKYLDIYYPFVLLLLLGPIYYSAYTFIYWGASGKTKEERLLLFWAVIFAMVSVIMYTIWEMIYISFLY